MRDPEAQARGRSLRASTRRRGYGRSLASVAQYARDCSSSPLILDHRACLTLVADALESIAGRAPRGRPGKCATAATPHDPAGPQQPHGRA